MSPDDPRHGTVAGNEQHRRDSERPCGPCRDAKLRDARRRVKRKTQGVVFTLPAGRAHEVLQAWRDGGASVLTIAKHLDVSMSVVARVLTSPEQPIYARTYVRILDARSVFPLTSIGATRRVQALQCRGWTGPQIAEAAGIHRETVRRVVRDSEFAHHTVRAVIAEAFDELHMKTPSLASDRDRAASSRAANRATRMGWLPPLAWDVIDDAREVPDLKETKRDRDEVDHVRVQRFLEGDHGVRTTPAEKTEIARAWAGRGRPLSDLADLTGWKVERYYRLDDEVA